MSKTGDCFAAARNDTFNSSCLFASLRGTIATRQSQPIKSYDINNIACSFGQDWARWSVYNLGKVCYFEQRKVLVEKLLTGVDHCLSQFEVAV